LAILCDPTNLATHSLISNLHNTPAGIYGQTQ
jgi:hypothetical protein